MLKRGEESVPAARQCAPGGEEKENWPESPENGEGGERLGKKLADLECRSRQHWDDTPHEK